MIYFIDKYSDFRLHLYNFFYKHNINITLEANFVINLLILKLVY